LAWSSGHLNKRDRVRYTPRYHISNTQAITEPAELLMLAQLEL